MVNSHFVTRHPVHLHAFFKNKFPSYDAKQQLPILSCFTISAHFNPNCSECCCVLLTFWLGRCSYNIRVGLFIQEKTTVSHYFACSSLLFRSAVAIFPSIVQRKIKLVIKLLSTSEIPHKLTIGILKSSAQIHTIFHYPVDLMSMISAKRRMSDAYRYLPRKIFIIYIFFLRVLYNSIQWLKGSHCFSFTTTAAQSHLLYS